MNFPISFNFTFFLIILLVLIFSWMNLKSVSEKDKKLSFECGFEMLSPSKSSFSTQFFLIMILFLVFDLEITVLLPFVFSSYSIKSSYILTGSFLILLTLGMLAEWMSGMLEWGK